MKRTGLLLLSFFLLTLVLFGSGRFIIGKTVCGDTECAETKYSIGMAKDCCDPNGFTTESFGKSCCCECINILYSLDDFTSSQKISVTSFYIDFYFSQLIVPDLHFLLFTSENIFSLADLPPPFQGKELVYLFRTLLL